MKIILRAILIFIVLAVFPQTAYAEDIDTKIGSQFDFSVLDDMEREFNSIGDGNKATSNFSIKDTAIAFFTGETDFTVKNATTAALKAIFSEVFSMTGTLKTMIILAVLSAVFSSISASFCSQSVSKLGFYVCYIVLITTILQSFYYAAELAVDTVGLLSEAMNSMLPVFITLMAANGRIGQMTITIPAVSISAQLISSIIRDFILPLVLFSTVLELINYISEKDILKQFSRLLKTTVSWGIKAMAAGFMFVLSILRLGSPQAVSVAGKTAKTAAEAVPVVGSIVSGTVETAVMLAGAAGNSIAVAIIIFVILLCAVPLLKLALIMLIYKFTSAVIEPVSEPRLVKCISAAGDYVAMLMGALFAVEVMFIFTVVVMLAV